MASHSILFCIVFWMNFLHLHSQQMAWLGGNMEANKFSSPHMPGGRSGVAVWQNKDSIFLFGGIGISSLTSDSSVLLNDMWHYNGTSSEWNEVLLSNMSTVSSISIPSSMPTQSSISNLSNSNMSVMSNTSVLSSVSIFSTMSVPQIPQPRQLAAVCGTDSFFIMFGGLAEEDLALGDLWMYNIHENVWKVLSGANKTQKSDNETVSIGPAPRGDMAHWCTSTHLFIFGGINGSRHIFRDMWKLGLHDFTWEELESSKLAPDSLQNKQTANYPAGRNGAMTWVVEQDTFFMFGGNVLSKYPRSHHIATGYISDLWSYNLTGDSWQFLKGQTQPAQPGVYGQLSVLAEDSIPGCRRGGATWTDSSGQLWLFGGEGADKNPPSDVYPAKLLSDIWRYQTWLGKWEWMGGSSKGDATSVFKNKGHLLNANLPGGRIDAATWNLDGHAFCMFGGLGHDGIQKDGYLSDLWLIDVSDIIGYKDLILLGYIFGIIFVGLSLFLCLIVTIVYAFDRKKSSNLRHGRRFTAKYSPLDRGGS